ncbi:hypothetical protein [Hungatella hathewayi]|uniref:hypothetical protein n=1 Tax=Hungatella hathewayi TaxID=154046 RepID=UPI0035661313
MKKQNKRKWTKRGMTSIEVVIGTLIFLLVFISICDFLVLSNRYSALTDTTKEVTRILSVQGGALVTKPASYQANYYNIEQLSRIIQKQMNGMGFKDEEYGVYIKYSKIYDDTDKTSKEVDLIENIIGLKDDGTYGVIKPTQKIDYLSDFNVMIVAYYSWPFTKSVFKLDPMRASVTMPGLSEWRYSYDGWTNED